MGQNNKLIHNNNKILKIINKSPSGGCNPVGFKYFELCDHYDSLLLGANH